MSNLADKSDDLSNLSSAKTVVAPSHRAGAGATQDLASSTTVVAERDTSRSAAAGDTGGGGRFGPFRLLRPIAKPSGEAVLWVAARDGTSAKCALKVYHSGREPKPAVIELWKKLPEAQVVRLISCGWEGAQFYEEMEYVEHGSLADWVQLGMAEPKVREVVAELHGALRALHAQGLIHRDIKPSNILVRRPEPLKLALTDFGISSQSSENLHLTSVSGTPAYRSPEAIAGAVNEKSDWWSVGVMVGEMLTGRHPLGSMSGDQMTVEISLRGIPVPGALPDAWRTLLQGLLTRDYQHRWGADEVERWLAGQSVALRMESPTAGQPYRFTGKDYTDTRSLALALATDWEEAKKRVGRGSLLNWVRDEVKDQDLISALEDIQELNADLDRKLSLSILAMNHRAPLFGVGGARLWSEEDGVDEAWKSAQPQAVLDLLTSDMPGLVERFSHQSGLLNQGGVVRGDLSKLRSIGTPIGDDIARWIFASDDQLEESIRVLMARYKGSSDPAAEALLEKTTLTRLEKIALLGLPPGRLRATTRAEEETRLRVSQLQAGVERLQVPVDKQRLLHWSAQPTTAILDAVRQLAARYRGADHPGLESLLGKSDRELAENVALLCAPESHFLRLNQGERGALKLIGEAKTAIGNDLAFLKNGLPVRYPELCPPEAASLSQGRRLQDTSTSILDERSAHQLIETLGLARRNLRAALHEYDAWQTETIGAVLRAILVLAVGGLFLGWAYPHVQSRETLNGPQIENLFVIAWYVILGVWALQLWMLALRLNQVRGRSIRLARTKGEAVAAAGALCAVVNEVLTAPECLDPSDIAAVPAGAASAKGLLEPTGWEGSVRRAGSRRILTAVITSLLCVATWAAWPTKRYWEVWSAQRAHERQEAAAVARLTYLKQFAALPGEKGRFTRAVAAQSILLGSIGDTTLSFPFRIDLLPLDQTGQGSGVIVFSTLGSVFKVRVEVVEDAVRIVVGEFTGFQNPGNISKGGSNSVTLLPGCVISYPFASYRSERALDGWWDLAKDRGKRITSQTARLELNAPLEALSPTPRTVEKAAIAAMKAAAKLEGTVVGAKTGDARPFSITDISFTSENRFRAKLNWPTLHAVHEIEGAVNAGRINFKEVSYVTKGTAALNFFFEIKLWSGDPNLQGIRVQDGAYDRELVKLTLPSPL